MKQFTHTQLTHFHDLKNLKEIKQYNDELKSNKLGSVENIVADVSELRESIQELKANVLQTFSGGLNALEKVHRKMLEIENKIALTVENIQQKFLLLSNREKILYSELMLVKQKLPNFINSLESKLFLPVRRYHFNTNHNENPLTKFQNFLSITGGHCGGWTEQDHFIFLKERQKFSGRKFIAAVHFLLPNLNIEDIVAHENWFKKYEHLRNLCEKAKENWKTEKKYLREKKMDYLPKKQKTFSVDNSASRKCITHRITKWKEKQLLKKEEAPKKKNSQQEIQKAEIQKYKNLAINDFKNNKFRAIEEEVMKNKNNFLISKEKKNISLKTFNVKDLKLTKKKVIAKPHLESTNTTKIMKNSSPREPQRILKSTFVWTKHCEGKENKIQKHYLFDLKSIPKRAIPEWRKEIKILNLQSL